MVGLGNERSPQLNSALVTNLLIRQFITGPNKSRLTRNWLWLHP